MKITITQAVAASLVIAIAAAAFLVLFPPAPASASGVSATPISMATTSAAFSVTTSARVLATTTNPLDPAHSYIRVYATICTTSSNPVALNLDGDKAANGSTGNVTSYIAAAAGYSACYEVTDRNQYSGSITASSTNQTATAVTVKDYVQ